MLIAYRDNCGAVSGPQEYQSLEFVEDEDTGCRFHSYTRRQVSCPPMCIVVVIMPPQGQQTAAFCCCIARTSCCLDGSRQHYVCCNVVYRSSYRNVSRCQCDLCAPDKNEHIDPSQMS